MLGWRQQKGRRGVIRAGFKNTFVGIICCAPRYAPFPAKQLLLIASGLLGEIGFTEAGNF